MEEILKAINNLRLEMKNGVEQQTEIIEELVQKLRDENAELKLKIEWLENTVGQLRKTNDKGIEIISKKEISRLSEKYGIDKLTQTENQINIITCIPAIDKSSIPTPVTDANRTSVSVSSTVERNNNLSISTTTNKISSPISITYTDKTPKTSAIIDGNKSSVPASTTIDTNKGSTLDHTSAANIINAFFNNQETVSALNSTVTDTNKNSRSTIIAITDANKTLKSTSFVHVDLNATHEFTISYGKQEFDTDDFNRTRLEIVKDTGVKIKISLNKNQSLAFLISGKEDKIREAIRKIIMFFESQQASSTRTIIISDKKELLRESMSSTGPSNQALTFPQTDEMKVQQKQTQPKIPMRFTPQQPSVRGNQNMYFSQMSPPTRSRQPMYPSPPVPTAAGYQTSFSRGSYSSSSQGSYPRSYHSFSTRSNYVGHPYQPSQTSYVQGRYGAPPLNINSRTLQSSPAGPQRPTSQ